MSDKIIKIIGAPTDQLNDSEFRQRQNIDRLASKGMTAAQIADELGLSVSFVGSVIIGG